MTNMMTNTFFTAGSSAVVAAGGFVAIATFQAALAFGAPLGRAAWGGTHVGALPAGFRLASGFALVVWLLAALIVLGRAGFAITPLPSSFLRVGTWVLVGVLLAGALMNIASSSPWERYIWAPFTLTLAALCFLVARDTLVPLEG